MRLPQTRAPVDAVTASDQRRPHNSGVRPDHSALLHLQRSAGNAAVSSFVMQVQERDQRLPVDLLVQRCASPAKNCPDENLTDIEAVGSVTVQRCGPTPCDCSDAERADFAARHSQSIPAISKPEESLIARRSGGKAQTAVSRRLTAPTFEILQRGCANVGAGRGVVDELDAMVVQRTIEAEGTPGHRPNLDIGDSGAGVELLQRLLKQSGTPCNVDGTFGPGTRRAVVNFQKSRPQLHPATGGVGAGTWAALDPAPQTDAPLPGSQIDASTNPTGAILPPSTINPLGTSTSSDPLTQLETYVFQKVLKGEVSPWIVVPLRCFVRTAFVMGFSVFRVMGAAYDIYQGLTKASAQKGRFGFQHLVSTALLYPGIVGDCLTLPITIGAEWIFDDKPHALATFRHYKHGRGADKYYNMQEAVREDEGFRLFIQQNTRIDGRMEVHRDVSHQIWNTTDWQYTFGGVDHVALQLVDKADPARSKVRVVVADPYQWHPDELIREGLLLHPAMEALKQTGAQEFMQRDDGKEVEVDLGRRGSRAHG